ncbi:hypothetical protein Peur_042156 [Populus x canadensis]
MPNVLEIGRWCHVHEGQMKSNRNGNSKHYMQKHTQALCSSHFLCIFASDT